MWRHRLRAVARRRSRLTRAAGMWALAAVVLDHVAVSSVARILGIAWHTAHTAVAELGLELLIGHPARLDNVAVVGVDEHCWRHIGFASDRFVTVIVDLTPVHDRSGPARLLDLVEGRSASVFQTWLDAQPATTHPSRSPPCAYRPTTRSGSPVRPSTATSTPSTLYGRQGRRASSPATRAS